MIESISVAQEESITDEETKEGGHGKIIMDPQTQKPLTGQHGPIKLTATTVYVGQWEGGLPHGKGMKRHKNGASYDGQW